MGLPRLPSGSLLRVATALVLAALAAPAAFAREAAGPFTLMVEIAGVTQGDFQVVEGLASRSEVVEAEEDNPYLYPAPGRPRWSPLVLKRAYHPGFTGLWNWRRSVLDGSPMRRDGRILLFDADGRLAASWVFRRGWPSRWEVTSLSAGASEAGTEIIEIVHEGLDLED